MTLKSCSVILEMVFGDESFKAINCTGTDDPTITTRGSAIAEEPRDALCQLKYFGRFLTELLTRSSANAQEPCEHTVS